MDDFWFLEQLRRGKRMRGPAWAREVVAAWNRMGIQNNAKKVVDADLKAEVQGAEVHPAKHTVGLAREKTEGLLRSVLWLLCVASPAFASVDRGLGKVGTQHVVPARASLVL